MLETLATIAVYLFLNACVCVGAFAVTRKGFLLYPLVSKVKGRAGKPLINCPTCMGSVWGIAGWTLFIAMNSLAWQAAIPGYLLYPLALAAVNGILQELWYGFNTDSDE